MRQGQVHPAWLLQVFLLVVTTSPSTSVIAQQTCERLPSQAVSWWPGDGNAIDISGGYNGTPANGAGFATGEVLQGFSLDGIDDFIIAPDVPDLDPLGSFTIEAWVKTSVPSGFQVIVAKYDAGNGFIGCITNAVYQLYLDNGKLNFHVRDGDQDCGAFGQVLGGTTIVADGTWHHIAGIRDMLAGMLTLYLDGALEAQAPLTSESDGTLTFRNDDGPDPLRIGAISVAGSTALSEFFSGQIDEVAYYNRALSLCEINALFEVGNAGKCKGDGDADTVSDLIDNCVDVYNPTQEDLDGDGAGNACDCSPGNSTVFSVPGAIRMLHFSSDAMTLSWCSAAPGSGISTVHDVPRGALGQFPVGSGASETCLGPGVSATTATDSSMPVIGEGFWYMVRGRNGCGAGTYGARSDGAERTTSVCP